MLSKITHFSLFRDTLTDHFMREGLEFLKGFNYEPESLKEACMSVWLAHCVLRYAVIAEKDDRWQFGSVEATASNRAFRDNVRVERSCHLNKPVKFLHKPSDAYWQTFSQHEDFQEVMPHYCAIRGDGESISEVVDLMFFRWRDEEVGVSGPTMMWLVMGLGDGIGLNGAEWENFSVVPADMDTLLESFPMASKKSQEHIDRIIMSIGE